MRLFCLLLALALGTQASAEELRAFGLASLEPVSDVDGTQVRGLGLAAQVKSLATQSFALSIADQASGSVINMNSNSQILSHDAADISENASGSSQAVGAIAQAGIQFGDATFELDEFSFSLTGFTAVSQSSLAAGPAGVFDFSSLGGN